MIEPVFGIWEMIIGVALSIVSIFVTLAPIMWDGDGEINISPCVGISFSMMGLVGIVVFFNLTAIWINTFLTGMNTIL
jgi:hypothetical protein